MSPTPRCDTFGMGAERCSLSVTLRASLFVFLFIVLLFECVDMLSEAVEALFDCGFGNGERVGDVA